MIVFGSKKNLYMGIWIVSGLLLLGYNGFALVSIFNPPIVGRSDEVRLASEKWRQLQDRGSLARQTTGDRMELAKILSRFIPGEQKQEQQVILSALPALTGIMRFSDVHGNARLVAVIQGKTYAEKTKVQEYIIQQITEKGIVLTKAGISRFVPAPEVYFSLDRSGLIIRDKPGATEQEESFNASE